MILLLNTTMAFNVADSKDLYANYCIDLYNLLVLKKLKFAISEFILFFWEHSEPINLQIFFLSMFKH